MKAEAVTLVGRESSTEAAQTYCDLSFKTSRTKFVDPSGVLASVAKETYGQVSRTVPGVPVKLPPLSMIAM